MRRATNRWRHSRANIWHACPTVRRTGRPDDQRGDVVPEGSGQAHRPQPWPKGGLCLWGTIGNSTVAEWFVDELKPFWFALLASDDDNTDSDDQQKGINDPPQRLPDRLERSRRRAGGRAFRRPAVFLEQTRLIATGATASAPSTAQPTLRLRSPVEHISRSSLPIYLLLTTIQS